HIGPFQIKQACFQTNRRAIRFRSLIPSPPAPSSSAGFPAAARPATLPSPRPHGAAFNAEPETLEWFLVKRCCHYGSDELGRLLRVLPSRPLSCRATRSATMQVDKAWSSDHSSVCGTEAGQVATTSGGHARGAVAARRSASAAPVRRSSRHGHRDDVCI